MASRTSSSVLIRAVYAAVFVSTLPSLARGQSIATRPTAVVHLRVVDDHGKPVDSVTVSIVATDSSGNGTARYLLTAADGRVSPRLATSPIPYQYVARKLGFAPTRGTIIVSAADTIPLDIHLVRTAQALDTVRTEANQRILMSNYVLGAAEIARSKMHIVNAFDAMRYLRPTLLGLGPRWSGCPWAENLWVNGQLQPLSPLESYTPISLSTTPTPRDDGSGRPAAVGKLPGNYAPPDVPLAMIKSQYISEMHYVDCWHSEFGNHGQNALYISLKPGIAFDIEHGTYIADSAAARAAHVIQ